MSFQSRIWTYDFNLTTFYNYYSFLLWIHWILNYAIMLRFSDPSWIPFFLSLCLVVIWICIKIIRNFKLFFLFFWKKYLFFYLWDVLFYTWLYFIVIFSFYFDIFYSILNYSWRLCCLNDIIILIATQNSHFNH